MYIIDGMLLDLAKYNLEQLAKKSRKSWTESELDLLLDAFNKEDIYPAFNIEFNLENVTSLLEISWCRQCGRCCIPDPNKPNDCGIMVHEDELKQIGLVTGRSYKELLRETTKDKTSGRKRFRLIRYPCMFHSDAGCTVYKRRPTICCTYPITTDIKSDGTSFIKINIRCEYGRDIYKALHRRMVQQD
jgi:Fe-S-cluster containining protein